MADDTIRHIRVQTPEERRLNTPLTERQKVQVPKEQLDGKGLARADTPPIETEDRKLERHLRAAPDLARRMFRRELMDNQAEKGTGTDSTWVSNLSRRLSSSRLRGSAKSISETLGRKRDPLSRDALQAGTISAAQDVGSMAQTAEIREALLESAKISSAAQGDTVSAIGTLHAFHMGPHLRYLTNDMTATYQKLYLQKEQLHATNVLMKVIDNKLEAIKHNTAAADIRKRTIADVARDTVIRMGSEALTDYASKAAREYLGPLFREKVGDPLKGAASAWAHSDKVGAKTFRKFHNAATAAQENMRDRTDSAAEFVQERTKDFDIDGAKDVGIEKAQSLGAQFRERASSAASRMSASIDPYLNAGDLQDRFRRARFGAAQKAQGIKDNIGDLFKSPFESSIEQPEYQASPGEASHDRPLLSEVEQFHTDFNDHASHAVKRGDQVIELLGIIAQNIGTGGGDGTGESASLSRGPWWRRSLTDLVGGIGRGGMKLAGMYMGGVNKAIGVAGQAVGMLNPFSRKAVEPFVDVYRKGEVSLGSPLVSARQLREGLIFADGEPVGDVADIDQPVIHPMTQQVLISQEDIDHGLVDVHGTPLGKRGATASPIGRLLNVASGMAGTAGRFGKHLFSKENPLWGLYGKVFDTLGSVVGAFGNVLGGALKGTPGIAGAIGGIAGKIVSPLLDMYKGIFDLGLGTVKMGVQGAGKLMGRIFGFDVGSGASAANRKDLQEIIGDRLDDIYEVLVDQLTNCCGGEARVKGDTDGDGDREGSYQDYLQKIKDRKAARNARAAESAAAKAGGGAAGTTGILGALGGLLSGRKEKSQTQEVDSEDEDDGSLLETAAGVAAGAAAPGLMGRFGRFAKGGLGKIFGKGASKAAAAAGVTGASAAAKTASKVASKVATKSASKTVAKVVGKGLLKKIPFLGALAGAAFAASRLSDGDVVGALGEFGSGLVSIVPFVGTAASVAIDGWLAYRDATKTSGGSADLLRHRLAAYGVSDSKERIKAMLTLEDRMYKLLTEGETISRGTVQAIMPAFGFDPENKDHYGYIAGWLRYRVRPIYAAYLDALRAYEVAPEDSSTLDDETAKLVIQHFVSKTRNTLDNKVKSITPDLGGYRRITGAEEKDPQSATKDAPDREFSEEPAKRRLSEAQRRRNHTAIVPQGDGEQNRATANRRNRRRAATSGADYRTTRGARSNNRAARSGAGPVGPVDMSKLGSLSANYESSTGGSAAIGYDRMGGTSYGKYQLSSKSGTFARFLRWLDRKGGVAKEIAERLTAAGPADTGSVDGAVPDEWVSIVNEGLMGDYEHQFIKETHYDETLKALDTDLRKRIEASPTLQNVVWSTAVQHGPDAAAKIVTRNAGGSGRTDDAAMIRKLYTDRKGQFDSSTPKTQRAVRYRLQAEETSALAFLEKEGADRDRSVRLAAASSLDTPVYNALGTKPSSEESPGDTASRRARRRASGEAIVPATPEGQIAEQTQEATLRARADRLASMGNRQTPVQATTAQAASIDTDGMHSALSKANAPSVDQLQQVNTNLARLTDVMVKGLGEDGELAKVGLAVSKASEVQPNVIVQAPVLPPQPPGAPGGRLRSRVDMNLSRTGNDAGQT